MPAARVFRCDAFGAHLVLRIPQPAAPAQFEPSRRIEVAPWRGNSKRQLELFTELPRKPPP